MHSAIRTNGLTKRFGSLTAVDGIDLVIPTGQVVALLGPNGAGKSTLTEMILGLSRPDAGSISVLGTAPQQAMRGGGVGGMLQSGTLLDGVTVGQLLRLMSGLHTHPQPLQQVIEQAKVGDILRTRTEKLSGGQAQRVRLALALLPDPELLLLDEPTVAMDVEARRDFWDQMRTLAERGRTILFATHYLDEADQFAERIIVLNAGRVVADGPGAAIKQQVAGRTVSFTTDAPTTELERLPGVTTVTRDGARVDLSTTDSDATLLALPTLIEPVSGIELRTARLEDAFLQLTH